MQEAKFLDKSDNNFLKLMRYGLLWMSGQQRIAERMSQ
ncbi:MAG: hypothetical protein KatS3mg031_1406 [Chitinophagales bacterium]|nr:MAG: hypothetical protein KatS3mg031_1406 [Chitinophagales bacterium]